MWTTKLREYLFISAFLLLIFCPTNDAKVQGTIMFDLADSVNATYLHSVFKHLLTQSAFVSAVQTANLTFTNFPKISLYTTANKLVEEHDRIQNQNTFITIGGSTYYGIKLSNSGINTSYPNIYMNYVPVFDFPIELQAKIIEKVYAFIRKDDTQQATRTMFVLNSTTVNPIRPWENVEILNAMLREISGSLRFMYYKNNSDEIARKIRDTGVNDVITMINSEASGQLLKAASKRSLLRWRYRWVVYLPVSSSLDITKIGFNENSQNITIIQFADTTENATFPINTALSCVTYDAMEIVMLLLQKIVANTEGPTTVDGKTGTFSINYGNLRTNPPVSAAVRHNWTMHVYHGLGARTTRVGNITGTPDGSTIALNIPSPGRKVINAETVRHLLQDNPFKIITILEVPFVQLKANHSLYPQMKDKLEGFVVDVIKALMESINISYTIELDQSGKYGSQQADGRWSGMILQIMNGRADMAASPFSVTNDRKRVVDFLESFKGFKGALLLKENTEQGISAMFQFLRPFDWKVWAMLLGSMLVITIVLALLHCISPNKTNYNLYESFFFSLGSVFQGVTTTPPDKPSGRIIVCFWWFFSLIIVITYIANYGAYRTQARIQGVISSLQDLLNQNQYKYGTVKDTAYDTLFKTSTFEYMQKLNKMIRQEFKDGLINNADTGLNLVRQGQYAFIWDNTITRYYAYKYCLKSTAEFDQYYYAFAIPKKADYKDLFNQHMLKLKETNVITNLIAKYPYMDGSRKNPQCQFNGFLGVIRQYIPKDLFKYSSSDALTLEQTLGIFIIMISGCIISLILALIECACRLCCQKCMERRTRRKNKRVESHA